MNLAPIVLFTYNRPWHTQQTVEALQNNELAGDSELFIFSDGAKKEEDISKVQKVREYLRTIKGFKRVEIIEREKNWGLANNIIDGVTKIVNEYGKIIVLEDDIVTSPYFLKFMNEALEIYKDEERVASISAYIYPVKNPEILPETFFLRGADCWGWATWDRAWKCFETDGKKLLEELIKKKLKKTFDFNNSYSYTKMLENQVKGKNDSWAVRWYASTFLRNMLTLYPRFSLIQNIGLDNSGTHCKATNVFDSVLATKIKLEKIPLEESILARKAVESYLRKYKYIHFKEKLFANFEKIFLGKIV